jgi:hypothetical protein
LNIRRKRVARFLLPATLALGLASAGEVPDTVVTTNVTGTLGPKLAGSDPIAADGQHVVILINASASSAPIKKTADSATYRLPEHAVKITIGNHTHNTYAPSTMQITVPPHGADTIVLHCTIYVKGIAMPVVATISLAAGSFSKAVLSHPTTFKSPQHLTSAATAVGPGNKLSYTALGGSTVLGLTGTANSHT